MLAVYLPAPLTDAELDAAIRDAIAVSQRDLGKVMGVLMPALRGRADGGRVNRRARDLLPPA